MNSIANVLDLELNKGWIIEIGLTFVDLRKLEIIKTVSMPIYPQVESLTDEIVALTGWTDTKLKRAGIPLNDALNRLTDKYGSRNRILVVDDKDELAPFNSTTFNHMKCMSSYKISEDSDKMYEVWNPFLGGMINVSDLFRIATNQIDGSFSLEGMLNYLGMEFDGRQHRGADDSRNIARIFIHLMRYLRISENMRQFVKASDELYDAGPE